MTTHRGFEKRRRVREERQRRAVEAVVAHARENGLCVEEPTVLNDLFSLMVHLKPAPVVARVATCMAKLRTPIEGWLEREIAVTTYLAEQGAPVVVPSQELPPGPHERDGFEALREVRAHFRNEIVGGRGGKQILLEDPSGNPIELFEPPRN